MAAITASIRQHQQLRHDRILADVSELRGVLDDAVRSTARAARFISEAARGEHIGDERDRRFDEAQHDLLTNALRMRIRLGDGAPYQACKQVAQAFANFSSNVVSDGVRDRQTMEFDAASETLAEAAKAVAGSHTSMSRTN
ncbi:hypothetical protein [Geodermatophilus sp. CPCC 205506]|uniref:hypothetical protein n=1 Tax=Geodermatophilus sp. CPCC 205506 TaxID=2936596 RepID=UPI003F52D8F1